MSSIAVRAASRVSASAEAEESDDCASLMTLLRSMPIVAVTVWLANPVVFALTAACMIARLTTTAAVMMVKTTMRRMEYPFLRHVDRHAFSHTMALSLFPCPVPLPHRPLPHELLRQAGHECLLFIRFLRRNRTGASEIVQRRR